MTFADQFTESAMDKLNHFKEEWLRHHLIFSGIVVPDKLGRFHRSQLDGVRLQQQVKNGWTYLTILDVAWEVARARYRWTDELKLEWEPLP